jgi:hypothetical protein
MRPRVVEILRAAIALQVAALDFATIQAMAKCATTAVDAVKALRREAGL